MRKKREAAAKGISQRPVSIDPQVLSGEEPGYLHDDHKLADLYVSFVILNCPVIETANDQLCIARDHVPRLMRMQRIIRRDVMTDLFHKITIQGEDADTALGGEVGKVDLALAVRSVVSQIPLAPLKPLDLVPTINPIRIRLHVHLIDPLVANRHRTLRERNL
mgnify:CR=1 FL=1